MMPKACTACHVLGCCTYYGWQPVLTMARVSGWLYGIKQGIGVPTALEVFVLQQGHVHSLEQPGQSMIETTYSL